MSSHRDSGTLKDTVWRGTIHAENADAGFFLIANNGVLFTPSPVWIGEFNLCWIGMMSKREDCRATVPEQSAGCWCRWRECKGENFMFKHTPILLTSLTWHLYARLHNSIRKSYLASLVWCSLHMRRMQQRCSDWSAAERYQPIFSD